MSVASKYGGVPMKRSANFFIVILLALGLTAFTVESRAGETKLTADEVRDIFIGKPWHGPNGAFLFREDGTYTYKNFDKSEPRGTWSYSMKADGTLEGGTTSYTFYKIDDGYRYFHSRSNRYYPARPNRPPFL